MHVFTFGFFFQSGFYFLSHVVEFSTLDIIKEHTCCFNSVSPVPGDLEGI